MSKENNFKEKFKSALVSTAKVISDDYKIKINKKNKSSQNIDFFELDNLNSRTDFIKYRAEIDSKAIKKKFANSADLHILRICRFCRSADSANPADLHICRFADLHNCILPELPIRRSADLQICRSADL